MRFRVNVWVELPFHPLIWVKVPTAYIVPPQSAIWRISSVVPVATRVGVPATGVGDTGPVAADAGAAGRQSAPAAPTAISALRTPSFLRRRAWSSCCMMVLLRGMGGSPGLKGKGGSPGLVGKEAETGEARDAAA